MKKHLLFSLLLLSVSLLAGQTWIRYYPWADVCTSTYTSATANVYNVIPALGGGYLLQGHAEFIYESGEYESPVMMTNIFWKIDENGDVVWRRIYNNLSPYNIIVSNGTDRYYCIDSSQGTSFMDIFDSELNHLAHYSFWDQNSFDLQLNDVVLTDDGLVFAGKNYMGLAVVLKTDYQFNTIWQGISVSQAYSDGYYKITKTNDDCYYAVGYDILAKYSADGDTLWTENSDPWENAFYCMTSNTIGTCYVLNRSYDPERWSVVTYNSQGVCENVYTLDVGDITHDGLRNMFELTDGSFIILIASNQQLNKVSPTGITLWSRSYPILSTGFGAKNLICENDVSFIFCGSGNLGRFTLVKTNSEGIVSNEDQVLTTPKGKVSHFPNPVINRATVKYEADYARGRVEIEFYNIRGQKLFSVPTTDNVGSFEIDLNISNMYIKESGIYLYVLRSGSDTLAAGRMVLIK